MTLTGYIEGKRDRKTEHELPNGLMQLVGGIGIRRDNTNFTKVDKGLKIVKNQNYLHPEGRRYIVEPHNIAIFDVTVIVYLQK